MGARRPKPDQPPPVNAPKVPTKATLRKYGLSADDWLAILERQGGVCAICKRVPESGILCVDHEHAKGWKKMPPEERKRYVRGLACVYCNRRLLAKGITTERAKAIYDYLEAYGRRFAGEPVNDNLRPRPMDGSAGPNSAVAGSSPAGDANEDEADLRRGIVEAQRSALRRLDEQGAFDDGPDEPAGDPWAVRPLDLL